MNREREKVVVAYLHPGHIHAAFHESLLDLLVYDMAFNRRIVDGGGRLAVQASANLAGPRNKVVQLFLEESKADWLWFLDCDMVFKPDTLEKLLEFADQDKAPIVGGLCFSTDHGEQFATLYGLMGDEDNPIVIRFGEWPPDTMFEVAATGTACLLIHRSALERIRDYEHEERPGKIGFNDTYKWFQETEHAGRSVGEDITFCWRALMCRIPVYVNTGVHIGHVKERIVDIDTYLIQRGILNPIAEKV